MIALIMPSPSVPRGPRGVHSPAVLRAQSVEHDDTESLRALFHRAIADLPETVRHELALRILHAHDRESLWQLRPVLLRAIALQFGERVARERLERLDMRGA